MSSWLSEQIYKVIAPAEQNYGFYSLYYTIKIRAKTVSNGNCTNVKIAVCDKIKSIVLLGYGL